MAIASRATARGEQHREGGGDRNAGPLQSGARALPFRSGSAFENPGFLYRPSHPARKITGECSRLNQSRRGALAGLDLIGAVLKNGRRRMPRKNSARNKPLSRVEKRELDVKISFLEGIVRRDPGFIEALQLLGDCLAQRGRHTESLKVDQRLSELEPDNPMVFYNLACSYALCSELDRAAAALERAINLGYRDFRWLARDPDLRPLRKHPLYRPIQDRIRKMRVRVSRAGPE